MGFKGLDDLIKEVQDENIVNEIEKQKDKLEKSTNGKIDVKTKDIALIENTKIIKKTSKKYF